MFSAGTSFRQLKDVIPRRHKASSLDIHPYFGKVDPGLASEAIELLSVEGFTILDPFCGSGTVLHDAVCKGRNAVGWDSSPLAAMISSAKVLGISTEETRSLQSLSATICKPMGDLFSQPHKLREGIIPSMPRVRAIEDWFSQNALRELVHIRTELEEQRLFHSNVVNLYARLAFSRIITAASKQRGESSYCRTEKADNPGRVINLFAQAVKAIIRSAKAFTDHSLDKIGNLSQDRLNINDNEIEINHQHVNVVISITDSRKEYKSLKKKTLANLVVTSPPYLMSWDYGLYHKFRFYWLGFDLNLYEDTEIGRHLRRQNDDVPRYIKDMTSVFNRLVPATSDDAFIVMVNAPAIVYGKEIDTNQLLLECASSKGWTAVWNDDTIGIPGPHHGMYSSLLSRGAAAPGQAGKREHVLIFRKTR